MTPAFDWTSDPETLAIIASCVIDPPRRVEQRKVYVLTTDVDHSYVGARVDRLAVIRERYHSQAMRFGKDGWPDVVNTSPTQLIDAALDAEHDAAVCVTPRSFAPGGAVDRVFAVAGAGR